MPFIWGVLWGTLWYPCCIFKVFDNFAVLFSTGIPIIESNTLYAAMIVRFSAFKSCPPFFNLNQNRFGIQNPRRMLFKFFRRRTHVSATDVKFLKTVALQSQRSLISFFVCTHNWLIFGVFPLLSFGTNVWLLPQASGNR